MEQRKVLSLEQEFYMIAKPIVETEIFQSQKAYKHHKYTNVYEHVLSVAYEAFLYAKRHNGYNLAAVVRGALLHDFYLYDRYAPREQTHRKGLHGFTHPRVAKENANKYFDISEKEENIILSHMWPLTFFTFPRSKEAWLIVRIDKQIVRKESKIKGPVYQFKIIKENINV